MIFCYLTVAIDLRRNIIPVLLSWLNGFASAVKCHGRVGRFVNLMFDL